MRLEEYAIVGNCETVALVGSDGTIDWLCWPRVESPACFAALLGTRDNGLWRIAPLGSARRERHYRPGTLVLETAFATAEGSVTLVDCMRRNGGRSDLIRIVQGTAGHVRMRMDLIVRFDYGAVVPWVSRLDDGRLSFVAGPQRLVLASDVETHGEDFTTVAEFDVRAGEEVAFALSWSVSYRDVPPPFDARAEVETVARNWLAWSGRCRIEGPWKDAVMRSLITLKALTHHETGGILAAATTSLPEQLGGQRNWDYRYCWLRDSTFTLYALMEAGFVDEARRWRDWLVRAVAGSPSQVQTMYDSLGRRHLLEYALPWLGGYENSRPVRVGNAAHEQFQLDIYGEVVDSLFMARSKNLVPRTAAWDIETALIERVTEVWQQPDAGIWEIRGPLRHFTHSKVMAWVALDRAVRSVAEFGLVGDAERWTRLRDQLHAEICASAYDAKRGTFVQSYGSQELDASLLLLPLVGFLPISDPRIRGTVAAIEEDLLEGGFVRRYRTESGVDGIDTATEGVFLACSFWLVDNYTLLGRYEEARRLFERLLSLRN
ncbi:MAG TPA: glycoside hydrolase family 15 protein, partial [Rudaea sp.]|nr:glycoside hydrolase family 15 protein [Rudaea sp.]